MKMQLGDDFAVQSIFVRNSSGTCAAALQPNTLRYPRLGIFPCHTSYGVIEPGNADAGDRLFKKTEHLVADDQKSTVSIAHYNMADECFMTVLIIRSDIEFI